MNKLVKFFCLVIVSLFLTVACQKDDSFLEVPEPTNIARAAAVDDLIGISLDSLSCFYFVYPIKVELLNGKKATLKDNYELFEVKDMIADFEYPLEIISNYDQTSITINKESEIEALVEDCEEKQEGSVVQQNLVKDLFQALKNDSSSCFNFVYPLSVKKSDESIVIIPNATELSNVIMDAKDFVYPIEVTKSTNGEKVIINNETELESAITDCQSDLTENTDNTNNTGEDNTSNGNETSASFNRLVSVTLGDSTTCYLYFYPLQLVLKNNSIITVQDDVQFFELLTDIQDFIYPISLQKNFGEGEKVTINNSGEIDALLNACQAELEENNNEGEPNENFIENALAIKGYMDSLYCHTFKYPIQVMDIADDENTPITISEEADFWNLEYLPTWRLVYPFTIIRIDNDQELEIKTEEELFEKLSTCN